MGFWIQSKIGRPIRDKYLTSFEPFPSYLALKFTKSTNKTPPEKKFRKNYKWVCRVSSSAHYFWENAKYAIQQS